MVGKWKVKVEEKEELSTLDIFMKCSQKLNFHAVELKIYRNTLTEEVFGDMSFSMAFMAYVSSLCMLCGWQACIAGDKSRPKKSFGNNGQLGRFQRMNNDLAFRQRRATSYIERAIVAMLPGV